MKTKTLIATLALLAATVAALPHAAAHTCRAYSDECDPNGCRDGEDHSHTRQHYWPKRDEFCESMKGPPPQSCRYFGIDWPKVVCDIIDRGEAEASPSAPCLDGESIGTRFSSPSTCESES